MPRRKRKGTAKKNRKSSTNRKSRVVKSKRKLVGFTKVGKKFALVFSRRGKPALGTKRFGSKTTMLSAAKKALTKK